MGDEAPRSPRQGSSSHFPHSLEWAGSSRSRSSRAKETVTLAAPGPWLGEMAASVQHSQKPGRPGELAECSPTKAWQWPLYNRSVPSRSRCLGIVNSLSKEKRLCFVTETQDSLEHKTTDGRQHTQEKGTPQAGREAAGPLAYRKLRVQKTAALHLQQMVTLTLTCIPNPRHGQRRRVCNIRGTCPARSCLPTLSHAHTRAYKRTHQQHPCHSGGIPLIAWFHGLCSTPTD